MVHGTNSFHAPLHASDSTACWKPIGEHERPERAGRRPEPRRLQALGRNYSRPGRPLTRGGAHRVLSGPTFSPVHAAMTQRIWTSLVAGGPTVRLLDRRRRVCSGLLPSVVGRERPRRRCGRRLRRNSHGHERRLESGTLEASVVCPGDRPVLRSHGVGWTGSSHRPRHVRAQSRRRWMRKNLDHLGGRVRPHRVDVGARPSCRHARRVRRRAPPRTRRGRCRRRASGPTWWVMRARKRR
jgi:hypothetical protein